jgi:hypothetical protein
MRTIKPYSKGRPQIMLVARRDTRCFFTRKLFDLPFQSLIPIFLLLPLLACPCSHAQAKRRDVVIMNNGDHFTGKVKRLQNGLLCVETDYVSGNIGLDWNQVQSVQSTATYRIVLNNGHALSALVVSSCGGPEAAGSAAGG